MKSGRAYGHTDSNLINARNERYNDSSDPCSHTQCKYRKFSRMARIPYLPIWQYKRRIGSRKDCSFMQKNFLIKYGIARITAHRAFTVNNIQRYYISNINAVIELNIIYSKSLSYMVTVLYIFYTLFHVEHLQFRTCNLCYGIHV